MHTKKCEKTIKTTGHEIILEEQKKSSNLFFSSFRIRRKFLSTLLYIGLYNV